MKVQYCSTLTSYTPVLYLTQEKELGNGERENVRYFQGLPRRLADLKDADSETHAPSQHCSSLQARTPCTSYKGGPHQN